MVTDDNKKSPPACADCHANQSELDVRRRRLCYECFRRYVCSKSLKRMDAYRLNRQVGNQPRLLLLPLSGGLSSLALLHVLDGQVKRQTERQGRTAFELVLVHAQFPSITDDSDESVSWRAAVEAAFPERRFLAPLKVKDVFALDPDFETHLKDLDLRREEAEDDAKYARRVLTSTKSSTARADLYGIVLRRLLVAIARRHGCESVIWGHSDSRLASETLAAVAKGRGGVIPSLLADGPSPYGVTFNYPLRDLFKAELETYVKSLADDIQNCQSGTQTKSSTVPVSSRNVSIDNLLSTYITSQGEKYPSIMANVVRTTSKLQVPAFEEHKQCTLCRLPIMDKQSLAVLCYGCERIKQDITK